MNNFKFNLHSAFFFFENAESTYEAPKEGDTKKPRINIEPNNNENLNKGIKDLVNRIRNVEFKNGDDKISFKKYNKDGKTIIERRVYKKFNKREYYADNELPGSYKRIRRDSIIIDENGNYKKSSEKSEFLIKIERENAKNKRNRLYSRDHPNQLGIPPEDINYRVEDATPKKDEEDLSPEKVRDELLKMRKEQVTLTDVKKAESLIKGI